MFRYGLVGISSLELRFIPLRSSDLFYVELKSITTHQTAWRNSMECNEIHF